jgi:peroxiredoxin Q/BCP
MHFVSRVTLLTASLAIAASVSGAQAAPAAPTALKVGDMAPNFSVTTVTANGRDAKTFKLSEHKGETVVVAFFPAARTRGCTVQMESYRDRYDELFHGGKKVTLIGVSVDADTSLISWAKDAKFPFHFGTDQSREVGVAFGASAGTGAHKRLLYVIDPTGRISYVAAPFNVTSADAYTDMGAAITKAMGAK